MTTILTNDIDTIRQSGLFDANYYLTRYPDVAMLGMEPIEHYLWLGAKLGRNPSELFSTAAYLDLYPDVVQAKVNPLLHYIRFGIAEGRDRPVPLVPRGAAQPQLHSSTFTTTKKYSFMTGARLDALGSRYSAEKRHGNQVAVFTAITGSYEPLNFHEHLMPDADYVVYSDVRIDDEFIYDARRIPYYDQDPVRAARFVKSHPHMLLPGYRIAVWIDGNILVHSDLSPLISKFDQSGLPVAAVPHPLRTSVFEEARECLKRNKDDAGTIEEQALRYRSEGFDTSELVESNFMMFRLEHPGCIRFLNRWWREIENGSRRDQLSFNYALQEAGGAYFPLTEKPNSVRNHPSLALFHHGSNQGRERPATPRRPIEKSSYADVVGDRIAAQAKRKVDIVVCVHNALEVVRPCLRSVATNRHVGNHRIVIVDDGSNEETQTWLADFASDRPNVLLIRHEIPVGYTKAANVGLRAMDSDMAILLNSDTVVAGPWVEKMLDVAFGNAGVGIVGPLSSAASHQSIPDHRSSVGQTAINDLPEGYDVSDMNAWCEANTPSDFIPRVPLVHGFCFGVTQEMVAKVGFLDEGNFPYGYGEENDYCFRAVDAGFSLAIATHTYVYHKKSQSYQDDRRVELMRAGNLKIRELHGKERVLRAVRNMQTNPHLDRIRTLANALYITRTDA